MNTAVIIEQIDLEISRLQQAKVLLNGVAAMSAKRGPGRPKTTAVTARIFSFSSAKPVKRVLSAEAKKRIADGQKRRWAKAKSAAKKPAKVVAVKTVVIKPAPTKAVRKAIPATKTVARD